MRPALILYCTQTYLHTLYSTSIYLSFERTGPELPCLGLIAEMTSFLFILKNRPVYPVWFDRALACVCRFVFCLDSLDVIGGQWGAATASTVHAGALINNAVFQVNVLRPHPNIQDK